MAYLTISPGTSWKRRKAQGKKLSEARKAGKRAYFNCAEPDKLFIDGVLFYFIFIFYFICILAQMYNKYYT